MEMELEKVKQILITYKVYEHFNMAFNTPGNKLLLFHCTNKILINQLKTHVRMIVYLN